MKTAIKPLFFKREITKPPKGLSSEARRFWKSLVEEYQIDDAAGLKLLQRSCEALDRMRRAQKYLERDGEVISDKKGSVKAHPGVKIEAEAHKQLIEALKMLNLNLEPLRDKPGGREEHKKCRLNGHAKPTNAALRFPMPLYILQRTVYGRILRKTDPSWTS